jgi:RNA polymerase sigma-70 factor (ECF subfamily)
MRAELSASLPAEQAVEQLLEQHGGRIYGLGLRLCGRPEDAEDLVQETFLKAYRKWHQFEGRSQASTWLYTIAARVCARRNRLKAGEPRRHGSLDELLQSARLGELGLSDAEQNPLESVLEEERQKLTEAAVSRLPKPFRLPLLLKELLELSVADTAEILGLKPATVKTRLHRARLLLAKELTRGLPRRGDPGHDHSRRACLDLLEAKQTALDRGVAFRVPRGELCARCRSVFASLDLAQEACLSLERDELPDAVRRKLLESTRSAPRRRVAARRRKSGPR